ncbi:hypothetical protein DPMN_108540 [Dreissena polymorpha]|uniref:Uncharacterized protein n=2 Tax=Dreissena polymorpha TaxID=45954 RepID=A0A9D4K8Q5_DREPO|nr:hypothetical protein DPMN_108540 [Dreissena polymorpha]
MSYSPNGSQTDFGSVLPTDTIESILDQNDIHDLLSGSWNNSVRDRNSSGSYYAVHDTTVGSCSPDSMTSDVSDGSFGLSPHAAYDHGRNAISPIGQATFFNIRAYSEPTTSLEQLTFLGVNNSHPKVQMNTGSSERTTAIQNKNAGGFLPLLQDPINSIYPTNDNMNEYGQCPLPELDNLDELPTFPQAFCGNDSNYSAYCDDSSIRQGYPCWSELQHGQQPCYTFL